MCVCVHTWAYVTGRPAETCVLRVAPGNAGESNLGSVKAGEMCLSAPRELVSWFLFDRLKLWHQPAPQPPPLTTASSSSKATTPAVHIAAIYLQLVLFLQTFFLQCYLYCMGNGTHIYGLSIFWLPRMVQSRSHNRMTKQIKNTWLFAIGKIPHMICMIMVFMAWCVCWFRECIRPNLIMDHLC